MKCLDVQERRQYPRIWFAAGCDVRQVEVESGSQNGMRDDPYLGLLVDVVVATGQQAAALADEGASPAAGVLQVHFAFAPPDDGQPHLRGWKLSGRGR